MENPHPCWLYPKGRDVGILVLTDLNLSKEALCIRRGAGIRVWRASLVTWSLGSDFLSLGSSSALLAKAAGPELVDTLHREVTRARTNPEPSAGTSLGKIRGWGILSSEGLQGCPGG